MARDEVMGTSSIVLILWLSYPISGFLCVSETAIDSVLAANAEGVALGGDYTKESGLVMELIEAGICFRIPDDKPLDATEVYRGRTVRMVDGSAKTIVGYAHADRDKPELFGMLNVALGA